MLSKFAPPNSSHDSDAVPRHSMLASSCLWGACGGSWLLVGAACGCSLLLVWCSWMPPAACGLLGVLLAACGVLVGPWAYMQPTPRRARHEDPQRGGQSCF